MSKKKNPTPAGYLTFLGTTVKAMLRLSMQDEGVGAIRK